METEKHAVIWDVDGTLVDTAEMHFQAWDQLCRDLGQHFSRTDFTATFGRRNPEILEQLFRRPLSAQEMTEYADRKEALYRDEARRGVALLPGVRELLESLHVAGFAQAIGSSAPRANVDLILSLTETNEFFQAVVSSEDTQRGKPDPQVFQLAALRLGVAPQRCVVIEDAVAGVQAAKAGGMKCVAVTFVGHHPGASLRSAGADLVTKTLEAITAEQIEQLIGRTESRS